MFRKYKEMKQQLVNRGKFKNYILYAIGEIILVVLGILIALQVNNWNEDNQKRKEEIRILKSFEKDLASDLKQLDHIIAGTIKRMQGIDSLFIIMHHPSELLMADFIKYNERITRGDLFELNKGTYDEGISSGRINYIKNDSLREKIFTYYRIINENLTQGNAYKILMETIIPQWGAIVIPSKQALDYLGLENSMPSLDLSELAKNKKYNFVLGQAYGNHATLIVLWRRYIRLSTQLKQEIQNELQMILK